jgi:hypothetical protein
MAQLFISESSRRNQQISEEEMEKNWQNGFGRVLNPICNRCGEKDIAVDKKSLAD